VDLADQWAEHALGYTRRILGIAPGRGSATQDEWRAGEEVLAWLRQIGIENLRTQEFSGLRSLWLFLGLAFGMALVGHAAYWLLTGPVGALLALGIALAFFIFSAYLLWRKFTFRDYPLSGTLPHGPSRNILATLPAAGEARRRVVLVGHLDSHRAVWVFASDFLLRAYVLITPLAIYGVCVAPVLYALADFTGLHIFATLSLLLALVHFVAWFTGMTADLGPYSPGANDNACAVGTLLALAERLKAQPLQSTEVWLAFTGCEETGGDGLCSLLEEYGSQLKEALFLDFELVGIGERLAYLQSEGIVRKQRIPADVERLVRDVGAGFNIQPLQAASLGVFTEAGVAWEHGFRAVCILVQSDGSGRMPEWHRLSDRGERLQAGALAKAHAFAWALLQKLDLE